ncbi:MAG TPA: phytoene/squalene synthase family protein [Anaerolineales bacterium]|nr:phytoene/squalene synthase family protein [Anaerolineales bacterium]
MTIHQTWESNLLALATHQLDVCLQTGSKCVPSPLDTKLQHSYQYCAELTAYHSRTFYFASSVMPYPKRIAIRALYAFCRKVDDIVDKNPPAIASQQLQNWRNYALLPHTHPTEEILPAWRDMLFRQGVPLLYAHQLIDGVASDFDQRTYANFDELSLYAYRVASTVGLMSMYIIGFDSHTAFSYAIKLGVALQMTNILRDVGEDYRMGRVYLPQDELAQFGITDQQLATAKVTPAWREFMQFQIARNRRLYEESLPGVAYLGKDGQLAVATAAVLYREILAQIEQNDYDVFSKRAHVGGRRKLQLLLNTWLRLKKGDFTPAKIA